jgi:hypothetical protein
LKEWKNGMMECWNNRWRKKGIGILGEKHLFNRPLFHTSLFIGFLYILKMNS